MHKNVITQELHDKLKFNIIQNHRGKSQSSIEKEVVTKKKKLL